ncbi:MAG: hypothetical protein LBD25_00190, partial [Coriobacteriales bacterium]|nr:hypothetical protein [Coriobacteriales bacterium]
GSGKSQKTYYDIDLYDIGRCFNLDIAGLTVEASSEKRAIDAWHNTNNVINAIMPFDIENAIAYDGNYLKGFNSQRRDTNVDELKGLVDAQIRDIARFQANATAPGYDAGISWQSEDLQTQGSLWRTAYLPVWLYSYLQVKSNGQKLLHYVAVNARTGETMGSVPVNTRLLVFVSCLIEAVALPIGLLLLLVS